MHLVAPAGKRIILKPVRPNLGVAARYDAELQKMINAMQADILKSITAVYEEKLPHAKFAQDASPAMRLRDEMARLAKKWTRAFGIAAPTLAQAFTSGALAHTDLAFKQALVQSGFSVKFQMTREMNDAYQAVIGENIGLIKSIAAQHLGDVQGMVMRSVQEGRSMAALTKDLGPLVKLPPKVGETARNLLARTKRRAALIARDQNNKASAVFTRVRQQALGITKAIWRHSAAGKTPRPEHEAFDGQEYNTQEGAPIADDGGMTWPGIEINCLPGDSVIEFLAGCKKLFRHWYSGDLTQLVTDSGKAIRATPNHPILTQRGWVPVQFVNVGDDVIHIPQQVIDGINADVKGDVPTIAELFNTASTYFPLLTSRGSSFQFHGDGTDGEVETVILDSHLGDELDPAFCKRLLELLFTEPLSDTTSPLDGDPALYNLLMRAFSAPNRIVSGFCACLSLLGSHLGSHNQVGLGLIARLDSILDQTLSNRPTGSPNPLGDFKLGHSGLVCGDDEIIREMLHIFARAFGPSASSDTGQTTGAHEFGDGGCTQSDPARYFAKGAPFQKEPDRVVDKRSINFLGHVYNLETEPGWFSTQSVLIHNCRCYSNSIISTLKQ